MVLKAAPRGAIKCPPIFRCKGKEPRKKATSNQTHYLSPPTNLALVDFQLFSGREQTDVAGPEIKGEQRRITAARGADCARRVERYYILESIVHPYPARLCSSSGRAKRTPVMQRPTYSLAFPPVGSCRRHQTSKPRPSMDVE
jgi:hypothetical protein